VNEKTVADELQRGSLPHPARHGTMVNMFADWQAAYRHLRDHLLTAPECHAWALVIPEYSHLVDPNDSNARNRYAEQARASGGTSAQPLYDLYCLAVSSDANDARRIGWLKDRAAVTAAMGTSGVVMLVEDVVKTAFLGGQGDPEATRQSQAVSPDRQRGLPRERLMRAGGRGEPKGAVSPRELRRQRDRESQWTADERLYHRVFKPSVQFVKRSYHRSKDMFGNSTGTDCALLKDVLPPRSRLKYERWLEVRRKCRGGA